ncbi:hypothetical protein SESBI_27049 [Sesbania bispinosa]|nr:hypothetical protein SESBI_27049 [Sesbania bispinosa]
MLTVINVYISAAIEINGKLVLNWYGIHGVDPLADDDTLRKQYRKLVHLLHPDNNKSIGADWAFKLVSQAWNILSDKAKRVAYDKKINARAQGKTAEEISKKPSKIQTDYNDKTTMKEITGNGYQRANEEEGKSVRNSYGRMNESEVMNLFADTTTYDDMEDMLSIDAPDPHFYYFDMDRIKGSFGENQVWSAFDEEEGMPQFYAIIHNVISMNPFKMQFSWLEMKKTKVERTPTLNCGASRFSRACGNFRMGRHAITNTFNFFSHKVRYEKGNDGTFFIYPKKGDVWALYRNWSSKWNRQTPDEVTQKYDMVEVLDVFNDFIVIPLVKVAGFRTIFRRELDLREIRVIPRKEILRFSHQVPSTILSGEEAPDAPKGLLGVGPSSYFI